MLVMFNLGLCLLFHSCSLLFFPIYDLSFSVHSNKHYWEVGLYCGEGNGNPLQYSCLENPRDGGAWWAAICGVAQSRTRLKWLSSSSRSLLSLGVRFLILSAMDVLGWIICCIVVDRHVHRSIFSSILGLYPLPINGNCTPPPSQLWQPEMSPDIVKCPLGRKLPSVENYVKGRVVGSWSRKECRCPHICTVLPFLLFGYTVSCLWLLDKKEKWGKSGGDKFKIAPSFLFCSNFILFGLNILEQYRQLNYLCRFCEFSSATD